MSGSPVRKDAVSETGLVQGQITDESVALMRERIGYPNPTLRVGILDQPWHSHVNADALRQYAIAIGDANPIYHQPDLAKRSAWGGQIAPPGFEMSMGYKRNAQMPDPEREKATSKALRGVQLFNSGNENFYWRPLQIGDSLSKAEWVESVVLKESEFAGRSALVTNGMMYWDQDENVAITGGNWFVHAERKKRSDKSKDKYATLEPAKYTDEDLAKIDAAYEAEYIRGPDTLYFEDVEPGMKLPQMVRGPLTVTDQINLYMGVGWLTYGNPPHKLAYENRKKLRGFYSKNQNGAWDTIQRVHWDPELAETVGVRMTYDIGPNRWVMVSNYCTNFAGDDGFVHYLRTEYRSFNYVGDTTWIDGEVTAARVDEEKGPLIELKILGINQRGTENIRGAATILLPSRKHGPVKMPKAPPMTKHRS
ncbi:MAG: MaoC family dehydratase N-terminal domain-containing protein [Hyphomonadaceae bacterium]